MNPDLLVFSWIWSWTCFLKGYVDRIMHLQPHHYLISKRHSFWPAVLMPELWNMVYPQVSSIGSDAHVTLMRNEKILFWHRQLCTVYWWGLPSCIFQIPLCWTTLPCWNKGLVSTIAPSCTSPARPLFYFCSEMLSFPYRSQDLWFLMARAWSLSKPHLLCDEIVCYPYKVLPDV